MANDGDRGGNAPIPGTPAPTKDPNQRFHPMSGGWVKLNQGKPDRSTKTPDGPNFGGGGFPKGD